MKNFAVRFTLAVAALFFAVNAHAQFADVTGGSLTIVVTPALSNLLAVNNVAAAGFTPAPYDNQIPYLGILGGVFSLANGRGSFTVQGEFDVTDGTNTLQVTGINFENVNNTPQVTGSIFYNSHFIAHAGFLLLDTSNSMKSLASGPFIETGLNARLSPTMIGFIHAIWGMTIPPNTTAAQLSINTGLAPI
jgi:hypothetical protein